MKKGKLSKQLLVLTTPEEHQFIKDLSDELDLSMGQVIRALIREKQKDNGFVPTTQKDNRQLSLV